MTNKRTLILSAVFGFCCLLILGLSIGVWTLNSELKALKSKQSKDSVSLSSLSPLGLSPADPWNNAWDPSTHFSDIQKRMDALLNSVSPGGSLSTGQTFSFGGSSPAFDMKENDEHYEVLIKVPDGQEVEIQTELDGDYLRVTGKISKKQNESNGNASTSFFHSNQFARSFYLAEPVDKLGMSVGRDEHGLVVTLPKV